MSDLQRRIPTAAAAAVLGLSLAVAACGGPVGSSSPGAGSTLTPAATPTPTAVAVVPIGSGPLVIDQRLLHTLPDEVAGVRMSSADVAALGMIRDQALGRSASGIAVGIVVGSPSADNDDLAVATVIQLRPGMNTDAFYKEWRADYDKAACDAAGGMASHAQQRIGAHAVEVTTCVEGATLYHTRVAGDRLVSITAAGDLKLGELVMAGLRE